MHAGRVKSEVRYTLSAQVRGAQGHIKATLNCSVQRHSERHGLVNVSLGDHRCTDRKRGPVVVLDRALARVVSKRKRAVTPVRYQVRQHNRERLVILNLHVAVHRDRDRLLLTSHTGKAQRARAAHVVRVSRARRAVHRRPLNREAAGKRQIHRHDELQHHRSRVPLSDRRITYRYVRRVVVSDRPSARVDHHRGASTQPRRRTQARGKRLGRLRDRVVGDRDRHGLVSGVQRSERHAVTVVVVVSAHTARAARGAHVRVAHIHGHSNVNSAVHRHRQGHRTGSLVNGLIVDREDRRVIVVDQTTRNRPSADVIILLSAGPSHITKGDTERLVRLDHIVARDRHVDRVSLASAARETQ